MIIDNMRNSVTQSSCAGFSFIFVICFVTITSITPTENHMPFQESVQQQEVWSYYHETDRSKYGMSQYEKCFLQFHILASFWYSES